MTHIPESLARVHESCALLYNMSSGAGSPPRESSKPVLGGEVSLAVFSREKPCCRGKSIGTSGKNEVLA